MTRRQRLTLLAAILGSAVVLLDGSVVNVALPAIERDLGGGLATQQWVANAYLLVLGSLILIGGSLVSMEDVRTAGSGVGSAIRLRGRSPTEEPSHHPRSAAPACT